MIGDIRNTWMRRAVLIGAAFVLVPMLLFLAVISTLADEMIDISARIRRTWA